MVVEDWSTKRSSAGWTAHFAWISVLNVATETLLEAAGTAGGCTDPAGGCGYCRGQQRPCSRLQVLQEAAETLLGAAETLLEAAGTAGGCRDPAGGCRDPTGGWRHCRSRAEEQEIGAPRQTCQTALVIYIHTINCTSATSSWRWDLHYVELSLESAH